MITTSTKRRVDGSAADDRIKGTAESEEIYGGDGDDQIYGNGGKDTIYGGNGDDEIDTTQMTDASGKLVADNEGDAIDGGAGNDIIDSGGGDDILLGGLDNDVLSAGAGNDLLDGGSGLNFLFGEAGDDRYVISSWIDFVYDSSGNDSGTVMADWYKTSPTVEHWTWAPGVQRLPYWIDALVDARTPGTLAFLGAVQGHVIYYAFAQAPSGTFTDEDKNGFSPFTSGQMEYTRKMFSYIESVLDIKFVETTQVDARGTILFGNNKQANSAGYASSISMLQSAVVMLADDDPYVLNPARDGGESFLSVAMHEMGHALGLKHPFSHPDTDGDVEEGPYLPTVEDTVETTVMSYTGEPADASVYSPFDLAALLYLFGPGPGLNAGNTVYRLDERHWAMVGDGSGNDTLDASAQSSNVTLYLEPGYWSHVGPKAARIAMHGQVTIDFNTWIENALGGSGDDVLGGNALGNFLSGGAGNDWLAGSHGDDLLDGGTGIDHALYLGDRAGYTVTLGAGGWTVNDNKGQQGRDKLTGIERLVFDDHALALDVDGIAAKAYRLYAAAFDRVPDQAGLGYWIAQMDKGMSLVDVATGFTTNAEFTKLYGAGRSNAAFLDKLYRNVLHREPDQAGIDFWLKAMQAGYTEGQVLAQVSEGGENQAQVIGQIKDGITYLPFGLF